MNIDKLFVALVSIAGIIFTYWFFLMKKEAIVKAVSNTVEVIVEGGYSPDVIEIPKGKTTNLVFLRKDPSNCLEEVVFGDFRIRRQLPLHKKVTVSLTPKEVGEYPFSCGMNMFHGKIIVT